MKEIQASQTEAMAVTERNYQDTAPKNTKEITENIGKFKNCSFLKTTWKTEILRLKGKYLYQQPR